MELARRTQRRRMCELDATRLQYGFVMEAEVNT